MIRAESRCDVLIVTAIPLEFEAVLTVNDGAQPGTIWVECKSPNNLRAARRNFLSPTQDPIHFAVVLAGSMGAAAAADAASPAIEMWQPRVVGMCGVCAGRRGKVALGDVILADRVWFYDYGKREQDGRFKASLTTYNLLLEWKQSAQRLSGEKHREWESVLRTQKINIEHQRQWFLNAVRYGDPAKEYDRASRCPNFPEVAGALMSENLVVRHEGNWKLTERGADWLDRTLAINAGRLPYLDQAPTGWRLHIGPIGSGSAVVDDPNVFDNISDSMRDVLGLEMELAAIGYVVDNRRLQQVHALLAKGVMDHADGAKNDYFKETAARRSAEFVISFLREHCPPLPKPSKAVAVLQASDAVSKTLKELMEVVGNLSQLQELPTEPRNDVMVALQRLVASNDPLVEQSVQELKAGKVKEAISTLTTLARDEERLAVALVDAGDGARQRAASHWLDVADIAQLTDLKDAAAAYEKALELDPFSRLAWIGLGRTHWWLGNFGRALDAYTRLLSSFPGGHLILLLSVDADQAQRRREKFLAENPQYGAEMYEFIARFIARLGLAIMEIFRAEPDLVTTWIVQTGPAQEVRSSNFVRRPMRSDEAPDLILTIRQRVYALGSIVGMHFVQNTHLETLNEAARLHDQRGQSQLATDCLNELLSIARDIGALQWEARALNNLGLVAQALPDIQSAMGYFEKALRICQGSNEAEPLTIEVGAWLSDQPPPDEGDHRQIIVVSNLLTELFGRSPQAALDQALALKEMEGGVHINLSTMAQERSDIESARAHLENAVIIFCEIGFLPGIAQAHELSGNLFNECGNQQEAAEAWKAAYRALQRMGNEPAAKALAMRVLSNFQKTIEPD